MTLTAETEPTPAEKAVAERVRKIREAQDTGVSRAEGWRQARTPASRADLHDRGHADPVPVHAVLLDPVVEPGAARLTAVRRVEQLHCGGPTTASSGRWRFNTVVLIVGVVLISALLGLLLALLLDRAFLGRGVVRTLLITPFLITPVAGALIWKTTILDPNNGILNWVLSLVGHRDRSTGSVSSR